MSYQWLLRFFQLEITILRWAAIHRQKTGVATLATAISQYKFETGEYPLNLNSLTVSNEQYGPYISSAALRDPWNQNYNYSYNDNSFAVWSNGPDKKNNSGGGVPAAFQGDDIGVIGH